MSSPVPLTSDTPSRWSRSDPATAREGPESPAATMPPTVDSGPNEGGSKARTWPCSASSAVSSATRMPAGAVTTSSVGSCSAVPTSPRVSSTSPAGASP